MIKRKSKSAYKKIKKKAWAAFSKWIRWKAKDENGNVRCVTCNDEYHWKQMQAGHFVDGRNNSVLFDRRLVHPQCVRCNVFLNGNKVKYTLYMLKLGHSVSELESFEALKHQVKKYTLSQLEEIIKECSTEEEK